MYGRQNQSHCCRALGRMGRETVKAILQDEELLLTAVVDTKARGETVSDIGFMIINDIGNDIELAIEELNLRCWWLTNLQGFLTTNVHW